MASQLGRLRKGREFDEVYREGTVIHGPLFVLRARPNRMAEARWGFAVGKKLVPHAVERNRFRRQLRETARREAQSTLGLDVIVTAKAKLLEASFADIAAEVKRLARMAAAKVAPDARA